MSSESMVPAPATLHEIFAASVICGPAQSFGAGSVYGQSERVLYEIKGGEVTGEINGKVLTGGDWGVNIGADFYADTRYTVQADDGSLLYFQTEGNATYVSQNDGLAAFYERRGLKVVPDTSLFRIHIRIECAASSKYFFLSRLTLVGAIERVGERVEYKAYAVL